MSGSIPALLYTALVVIACARTPAETDVGSAFEALDAAAAASQGLVRRSIPAEDPGPPFYARVGVQFFHDGGWIAIPVYREESCIPASFNLLDFFHFPGPSGPGAFACPLLMSGMMLIEPDAPVGTFPRQVVLEGAGAVPFWFVPSASFDAAAQDGVVTKAELASLSLLRGTAHRYHETLHPREGEHKIIIDAAGVLEDGRPFQFHVTHLADELRSIRIAFR